VVEENGILAEDIYNFDETGFAMSQISAQKSLLALNTTAAARSENLETANG
jgi:hypothetical protein